LGTRVLGNEPTGIRKVEKQPIYKELKAFEPHPSSLEKEYHFISKIVGHLPRFVHHKEPPKD
jgi:hypothetical protein